MSKSSLHVAFDAQLALLDNSLSRYVRNVVRQLVEVAPEFRISLLVFSPRTAELIRAEQPWIPEHVELVVMPGAETPHHLARQERLRRYYLATAWKLREIGADIYQGHYTNFPFPWRYRVVTIVHDVFQWVPHMQRMKGPLTPLRRALDRWLYRKAHLVCVSESTRRDFRKYLDNHHPSMTRIHEGADPAFRPDRAFGDGQVLQIYGLNEGRYYLYVGDLTPRKDVSTLIRAYQRAKASLPPDFRLAITRGHWTVCLERDLVGELGLGDSVVFLGQVPDAHLPPLYRHCYAFVFPSHYEGFGLPPLEAMASGVPVLTTDQGALAEVVGDAGLTFRPGDFLGLAEMLSSLGQNQVLRARLAEQSLQQAARFSWQSCALQLADVYRQVHLYGQLPVGIPENPAHQL